jgi:hypothetical protein
MAVSLLLDNKWGCHVTYITRGRPYDKNRRDGQYGEVAESSIADGKWNAKDLSS